MKPLQITLVENNNGRRRIKWMGFFKTTLVITAISVPITTIAFIFMGSPALLIMGIFTVGLPAGMLRAAYVTPLNLLPIST